MGGAIFWFIPQEHREISSIIHRILKFCGGGYSCGCGGVCINPSHNRWRWLLKEVVIYSLVWFVYVRSWWDLLYGGCGGNNVSIEVTLLCFKVRCGVVWCDKGKCTCPY